jgi:hypothetical protein
MGIGIFPLFKTRVDGTQFGSDGKVLAAEFELLDELAQKLAVRPFTSFGDNRAVPDDFAGDPDELEDLLGPWDEWFRASDGLVTVEALLKELSAERPAGDALVGDLEELRRCLQRAAEESVEFRLEMG